MLTFLQPDDKVSIIAPASSCTAEQLQALKTTLESWQLNCTIPDNIFGKTYAPYLANSDAIRLQHLQAALLDPTIKAVFIARGGYGSMRLIPALEHFTPPKQPKWFIGVSDATALQLFFYQRWQWPSIHGVAASDRFTPASIEALRLALFGERPLVRYDNLSALNKAATINQTIEAPLIGGNLTLVSASLGSSWQIDTRDKIIFLEEVGERGYKIDRLLQQLSQAGCFTTARAIIFGDFYRCQEPNGDDLSDNAIQHFAEQQSCPVFRLPGIGHATTNYPLPIGFNTRITCSSPIIALECSLS